MPGHVADAARLVRSGALGEIYYVRARGAVRLELIREVMRWNRPPGLSLDRPGGLSPYVVDRESSDSEPGISFHGTDATLLVTQYAIEVFPKPT
jgi:hypothetical protein